MYLFFDTETTGLPKDWKAPASAIDNWPRMVQLAWIIADENGAIQKQQMHIIRPEGYTIPMDAAKVHRITTQRAIEEGNDLLEVLKEFEQDVIANQTLVAHNMNFDIKIVGSEFIRADISDILPNKKTICTMLESVDYVKTGWNDRYRSYKWPTLQELHIKALGHPFEEAHDALVDVNATVKCFFKMKQDAWL